MAPLWFWGERAEKSCWQGEVVLQSKKTVHLNCFVLPSLYRAWGLRAALLQLADRVSASLFDPYFLLKESPLNYKPTSNRCQNSSRLKMKFSCWGLPNLWSKGSNQPSWHSQWQSRKVSTSPLVMDAPSKRARTKPSLLVARMRRTFLKPEMYFSNGSFKWASRN